MYCCRKYLFSLLVPVKQLMAKPLMAKISISGFEKVYCVCSYVTQFALEVEFTISPHAWLFCIRFRKIVDVC